MDKANLLQRYYSRLIALERRAPLTAKTYRIEIRKFLDWLEREKLSLGKPPSETEPSSAGLSAELPSETEPPSAGPSAEKSAGLPDLTRYLGYRRSVDGLDSRSVAKAISALRSFCRFLEDEGQGASVGFAFMLESPRRQDRLPEVHSREEVDRLLSAIVTESHLGIRNRALYELIYSAGLRISEAVSINLADLFMEKKLARVKGKGNKERLVIFGPDAAYWLGRYLKEARPKFPGGGNNGALFLNERGKKLSRKGIWKNYVKLAQKAGLGTKLHTLRHTFATELLAGGADLRSVQELLGHAEITTTQIYTHVDSGKLRDSHAKYLPTLKNWSAANADG